MKLQELPAAAAVVIKALEATENSLCNNNRLEEILSADPGAVADVLRLANSAYFGVSSQIRTVGMAVTVVGYKRLRILLRHLLVSKLWENLSADRSLVAGLRTTALAAGFACRELGKASHRQDCEDLLAGGLLHNVGEMALLAEFPREYKKAPDLKDATGQRSAEIAVLGVDSFTVSRWLLEAWRFPKVLIDAASRWNTPEHSSFEPDSRSFVGVVYVGVRLAQAWRAGLDASLAIDRVSGAAASLPGYRAEALLNLYERIGPGIERLGQSFGLSAAEEGEQELEL